MLVCATAAQKHLKRGYKGRDIACICWATRTLLELLVWTMYCAKSKQNTKRFYQDSVRDLAGAMAAYGELASDAQRFSDEQRALIDETEAKTMGLAAQLGVSPLNSAFLQVSAAADEVGLGVDFRKANKILSKMVHPTAYLVSTASIDTLSERVSENFFMAGFDYAMRVYAVLEAFSRRFEPLNMDTPPASVS